MLKSMGKKNLQFYAENICLSNLKPVDQIVSLSLIWIQSLSLIWIQTLSLIWIQSLSLIWIQSLSLIWIQSLSLIWIQTLSLIWIQSLSLIWIQTVHKGYQQKILAGKEPSHFWQSCIESLVNYGKSSGCLLLQSQ